MQFWENYLWLKVKWRKDSAENLKKKFKNRKFEFEFGYHTFHSGQPFPMLLLPKQYLRSSTFLLDFECLIRESNTYFAFQSIRNTNRIGQACHPNECNTQKSNFKWIWIIEPFWQYKNHIHWVCLKWINKCKVYTTKRSINSTLLSLVAVVVDV